MEILIQQGIDPPFFIFLKPIWIVTAQEGTPTPCDQAVGGELELLKVLRADAAQSSAWPGADGLTMDSGAWIGSVVVCSLPYLLWTSVQDVGSSYKPLCRSWGKSVFCQLKALTLPSFWGEGRKMQQKFIQNAFTLTQGLSTCFM